MSTWSGCYHGGMKKVWLNREPERQRREGMLFFKSHMLEKMDEFKLDALVLATAAGKDVNCSHRP